MKPSINSERLVATFVLGCVLLNYPLLALFGADMQLFGVPLTIVYLFAAWALLIALMALIVERFD